MTKLEIVNKATRTFARVGLKLRKYSPEIMTVVGTVGVVTSGVLACKATLKAVDVLDEAKDKIEVFHKGVENGEVIGQLENGDTGVVSYSEEDCKKDLTIVYTQTGVKFIKLYGPAVALGVASIGCIITGHGILRKRNVALAAAYTAIDKGFKDYRGRVIERFGKDLDRELRFNIKAKEIEETVVNEKGKEKTVKKTVNVVDPNLTYNEYSRCFDNGCTGWSKDPEFNKMFLLAQQNYANDLLKSRGHLFLNEVFDMLGFPRTPMGNVVGWTYDLHNEYSDGYVSFGIFDKNDEEKKAFINGQETSIWLDFNVDGYILDLI